MFVVRCLLFVACWLLSGVCCLLFVVDCCSLFVVCNVLFVVRCLIVAACCLLFGWGVWMFGCLVVWLLSLLFVVCCLSFVI